MNIDSKLIKEIAALTRSKGQTIDNDSRILVPIAISELAPLLHKHTIEARLDELHKAIAPALASGAMPIRPLVDRISELEREAK